MHALHRCAGMSRSRTFFHALVISSWLSCLLSVAQAAPPGLEVGQPAPDFALKDQTGKQRKLSELVKEGPVALVFYRSADW